MSQPNTNIDVNELFGIKEEVASAKLPGGNEAKAIKEKIMSIVQSFQIIDEERENIKEIQKLLKEEHLIKPGVSVKVAKYLRKPEKLAEDIELQDAIQALYDSLSK